MKRSKEKITLSILLAAVLVVGIVGYMIYVQRQFYTESTKNLLETYEQVDKTFTVFAQRNWNVLSEWRSNLQDDADGEAVRASLCLFNQQKPTWKYSGLYLFNEDCTYLDAESGHGSAQHIWGRIFRNVRHRTSLCGQLYYEKRGAPGRVHGTH